MSPETRRTSLVAGGVSALLLTVLTWPPIACSAVDCSGRPLVAFAADPEFGLTPSPPREAFRILVFVAVLMLLLPALTGRARRRRTGAVACLLLGPVAGLISTAAWAGVDWLTAPTRDEAVTNLAISLETADFAALQGLLVGAVAGLVTGLLARPAPALATTPPAAGWAGRGPLVTLGVAVVWWSAFGTPRYDRFVGMVQSNSRWQPTTEGRPSPAYPLFEWLAWPPLWAWPLPGGRAAGGLMLLVAAGVLVAAERLLRSRSRGTWAGRVVIRWLALGAASLVAEVCVLIASAVQFADVVFEGSSYFNEHWLAGLLGLCVDLAVPVPLIALIATVAEATLRRQVPALPVLVRTHPAGTAAAGVLLVAAIGLAGYGLRWEPDPRALGADTAPRPSDGPVTEAPPGAGLGINWDELTGPPLPTESGTGTWQDAIAATLNCPSGNPPEPAQVVETDLTGEGAAEVIVAAGCRSAPAEVPMVVHVYDGLTPEDGWLRLGALLTEADGVDGRGLRVERIEAEAGALVVTSRTADGRTVRDEFGWSRDGFRRGPRTIV